MVERDKVKGREMEMPRHTEGGKEMERETEMETPRHTEGDKEMERETEGQTQSHRVRPSFKEKTRTRES